MYLEIFRQHLRQELGEGALGVVLDNAGSHHRSQVNWPQNRHPLSLPPNSPELNPAEQILRHLRKKLSHHLFTTFDEWQDALIDELEQCWEHPTVLLHLTGYPWWIQAVTTNISSSS
jgi:transposase